jgi:hypothetical protein
VTTDGLQNQYVYKYVIYDENGRRVQVTCRKCGEIIAGYVDGVFKMLDNYTKVHLILSNNMSMFSAMSKNCVKHLSKRELTNVYKSEIQAIEWDAEVRGASAEVAPLVSTLLGLTVVRRVN